MTNNSGPDSHQPSIVGLRPGSSVVCLEQDAPWAVEQYRIARTKIAHHPLKPRLIVVTSPSPGDGKTVSAINLATTFALRSDANVLLVEADFRRSCVAKLLGIAEGPGIANVLNGECELNDAMVRAEQFPRLCVLPAGTSSVNPTELLDTPKWRLLCDTFRERFAFAIFDAPPAAAVADYELIEAGCDGVILVVRPDHTDRNLFRMAQKLVAREKMLGVLMNGADDWFLWKTAEPYYQYSGARRRV
jgi:capsular exopolysaccharide synthesis family protein